MRQQSLFALTKYYSIPITILSYISPSPKASNKQRITFLIEQSSDSFDIAFEIELQNVYKNIKKNTICSKKNIAIQLTAKVKPTIIHNILGSYTYSKFVSLGWHSGALMFAQNMILPQTNTENSVKQYRIQFARTQWK